MITIPDCIPRAEWDGFIEMRKKQKKPLTDRAIQLHINSLEKMRAEGHDIGKVLDQSTMNNWLGLFPVRVDEQRPAARSNFPSLGKSGQATANNLQDWLEDFV